MTEPLSKSWCGGINRIKRWYVPAPDLPPGYPITCRLGGIAVLVKSEFATIQKRGSRDQLSELHSTENGCLGLKMECVRRAIQSRCWFVAISELNSEIRLGSWAAPYRFLALASAFLLSAQRFLAAAAIAARPSALSFRFFPFLAFGLSAVSLPGALRWMISGGNSSKSGR